MWYQFSIIKVISVRTTSITQPLDMFIVHKFMRISQIPCKLQKISRNYLPTHYLQARERGYVVTRVPDSGGTRGLVSSKIPKDPSESRLMYTVGDWSCSNDIISGNLRPWYLGLLYLGLICVFLVLGAYCLFCTLLLTTTFEASKTNSIWHSALDRLQVYNWHDAHAVVITQCHASAPLTAVRVKFHLMGKFQTDTWSRYILIITHGTVW